MSLKSFLCIGFIFLASITLTATQDAATTERPTDPTATYGVSGAEIKLLLGNGGAGPTCVLQALSEDFVASQGLNIRIGWIQTISRLTLENLKEGVIDISLTYESEPELKAIEEGWAKERSLIFNDHFLLVGPKNNPAGILPSDSLEEAFIKIAAHGKFFSRDDLSGSNQRERQIWESAGLCPWERLSSWYVTEQIFPGDALKRADQGGLYTLTDRGTLLANRQEVTQLAVYQQESEVLMNRCHAMLGKEANPLAKQFLSYLKSERAQALIANYAGKDSSCTDCCPLFTPAAYDAFLETECLEKMGFGLE